MADTKVSGLTAKTTPADADVVYLVDSADTSSKKMTLANLRKAVVAGSATNGRVASFDASGKVEASSLVAANAVSAAATIADGNLAEGNGARGLEDSGIAKANVVTAAANIADGNLAEGNAAKGLEDSGIAKANVVTSTDTLTSGKVLVGGGDKTATAGTPDAANLVTSSGTLTSGKILVGGGDKTASAGTPDAANLVTAGSNFTENALPKGDAAKGLSSSGVLDDGTDVTFSNRGIAAFNTKRVAVSGTTLNISNTDHNGRVLVFTNGSGCAVTCVDSTPAGFSCGWVSLTSGTVSFAAGGGASVENRQGHSEAAGEFAMGTLYVDSNAGSAAVYILGGDTA